MSRHRFSHMLFLLLALVASGFGQGPDMRHAWTLSPSPLSRNVTPGAHCPLMQASSTDPQTKPHHCALHHQIAKHKQKEWRCNCASSRSLPASSETSILRFLLPPLLTITTLPNERKLRAANVISLPTISLTPPDPPPRSRSLIMFQNFQRYGTGREPGSNGAHIERSTASLG